MAEEKYVSVKGLENSITKLDILEYFEGLGITDKDIILHEAGDHRTASVKLSDVTAMKSVMEKHGKYWGDSYIEISEMLKEAGDIAFGTGGFRSGGYSNTMENMTAVSMRGLPFQSTNVDIMEFFKPHVPVSVNMTFPGSAIARFATQEDAQGAMSKHLQYMGRRYIELKLQSGNEDQKFEGRSQFRPSFQGGGGSGGMRVDPSLHDPNVGFAQGEKTSFGIHLRGLPYVATCGDVAEFLLPHKPCHIDLIRQANGWMSGFGRAYFSTEEEAEAALDKHLKYMGHRYIEITLEGVNRSAFGYNNRSQWDMLPVQTTIKPIACSALLNNKSIIGRLLMSSLVDNVRGIHTQPAFPPRPVPIAGITAFKFLSKGKRFFKFF